MKNLVLLFIFSFPTVSIGQNTIQQEINSLLIDLHEVRNNDENFQGFEAIKNEIGDASIVMLGEQSHSDATTFETKIKLIKYLHQEMDFEILAFESNLYECDRAWFMIQEGHDVKDAMGKGMFSVWAQMEELNPLYQYVEKYAHSDTPLVFAGFDPQYSGKLASDFFEKDLGAYIATFADLTLFQDGILELQTYINKKRNFEKTKKAQALENIAFVNKLMDLIESEQKDRLAEFWIQSLKSFHVYLSDMELKTDGRDKQMAENLIWLKEKYPNKKIICWGATSHFLYNSSAIKLEDKKIQLLFGGYYKTHSFMGDYIKEEFGDDVYAIGFVAHEGYYGSNGSAEIDLPSENSLEYLIGQASENNYFLPLNDISLQGYMSRPLSYQNMTTDISQVMDGVIFNRYMRRPYIDWDFHLYLVPENDIRSKKVEKIKKNIELRKLEDERLWAERKD